MSERELKLIIPRLEDILTLEEADLLQRAARGEFTCLTCGEPLLAEKMICEVYEGVILFCPDGLCGYVEL
jgi:hypothetical protein